MSRKLWSGVGQINDELISDAQKEKVRAHFSIRKRNRWIKYASLAACLCLIVCLCIPFIGYIANIGKDNGGGTELPGYPSIDATIIPEALTGTDMYTVVSGGGHGGAGAASIYRTMELNPRGFILTAKVTKVYPDTYRLYSGDSKYNYKFRLVRMTTLERISGQGIPDEFIYAIPDYLYVDLTRYDALLMSMVQIGTENVMVCNQTQNRIEFFPSLFSSRSGVRFPSCEDGNIIPFTDGKLDAGIWSENSEWQYYYEHSATDTWHFAPGMTLKNAIEAAKQAVRDEIADPYGYLDEAPTVVTLDFQSAEAKEAVEYVKSISSGAFAQNMFTDTYGRVKFCRYINGIITNERITIDLKTEEVKRSGAVFTAADLSCLPDIGSYISTLGEEYKLKLPEPPHIDTEGKTLYSLTVDGWYDKIADTVYGVVRIDWLYGGRTDEYTYNFAEYTDQAFILISSDGTVNKEVTREELLAVIGESDNTDKIYRGEYGFGEIQPMA